MKNTDIRSLLRDAIAELERAQVPSAALAAELLLMHALGRDREWIYAHSEEQLSETARQQFESLLARRASFGGELVRVAIARAGPIGRMEAWRAGVPLTQWTWIKP